MRGKTNKFLGILLALAMLLTSVLPSMSALAAGTAEVTLVSSAADALKPGDTFTVTPTIANNPGFAGVTWKLEYDNTALELTGITADGRKAGHLFGYGTFVSNPAYGNNNLVYANATLETENGALCELTFKVRDDAAAGDYTVNIAKSDADFKFVALNSVNVDVNFTAANVKVAGNQSEYADAYLAYCKGTAGAYEFLPVGEALYINNYAKADGAKELIAEYKIAVVNNGEIVSGMSDDKWAVEGNVFKTAAHTASDPDGVLTVNATGKLEDAAGTLTATLPDGTALSTNVHVTKTPWKIMANGVSGVPYDQYRSQTKTVYAYINDSFKFTYALQTATNGSVKGTNVKLSFASSDAKVATVAEDGTITAIGEGTAQISVKAVAYNYGVPTEIQLLNTLNVIVDKGFVTNFVLTDADGNVRTENITNTKNQTVPQLTMNAGEEITLNVKAMPGMIDAECAGTIANLKQFTVSTNKTALTATTVDTNTVTLKAADVTADTTVTVKSPQYYRSKASSANLWAEQFTLTVNIKAATAVESVSLNESALSMNTGDTANLTATVTPAEANQNVVWSTSNSEVATVENGVVTAVAAGTATIKATSASDETKFAECEVTVAAKPDYSNAYLAYCKGSKSAYEFIPVGDTLHINNWANGQKSVQEYRIAVVNNGEIVADMPNEKWSVENKANIFMNAYHDSSDLDGVFYINAHGKTDGATGSITATLPDGSTLTTNVVVTETPSDIVVNGVTGIGKSQYNNKTAYANIDEAFKFTYTYKDSSNNKVNAANAKFTFESADPAVATVAEDGTITAKGEGSTTITVYALTYYYGEITPIAMKTALSVTVDQNYIKYFAVADAEGNIQGTYAENAYGYVQPTITLNAGEEITLFAKGMPGKTEPVYSSTAKAFKLQSGSGITVTNNDDGSFTLKADDVTEETTAAVRSPGFYRSAANKKAASTFDTHVVIRPAAAVESVTVNPTAVELKEGETATLTATVNPENANQAIVWTSENEEVATVENGVVTALKAGTVTIKATSAKDDTKFATCEVTVKSNKSIVLTKNYNSGTLEDCPKAYGRDGVDITKAVTVVTEPAGLEYDLKVDLNGVLNNTIRAAMRYDADTHMLSIKNTYGIISNIPVVATLKDDPTVTSTVKISVRFIKVKVDGLTLADENGNTEGTYKVGDTLILKAVYNPANATTQDTRWESKNKDVATVEMLTDPDGESTAKVTIVGEGTAEIGVWPNNNEYSEGYKLRQTYAITVPATPKLEGLTALLGCDQTTVNVGDEIDVKLYVNSDNAEETYNAFKFGVNFSENLEYLGFTGLDTENDYNFVDAAGNTVTVSGFGASKSVSGENALVTLRFKATASGDAKITLPEDAAFANEKNVAVSENLQAIKVMNGEVTVKVVKTFEIPVTGGTVDGGKTVIPATEGESASFTPDQPENGTVIDKVLVDGEEVSPNPDGSYTIPNPTENTTVTIVTRKLTYNVTFTGNGAADANGAKTATHGEDYEFTITKDADYNYTVTATIAGKDVAVTGEYKISGADVTGDITIVITKTEKSEEETMRSVTAYLNDSAEGKEMAKVAKNAQNYVFSNPYTQTAKAIRATVKGTEVAITANDDGTWTIPGTFAGNVEIYFAGVYSVTKPEAITGEATAEYDKDYTFTVPAAYATGKPTATIGGEAYALSDGTADENGDIVYTISGKDVKGDIVISLPDPTALVEVNLYFKAEDANGEARNVYIVTAKPNLPMPEGKVFAYNGEAMFWSEEYQAYAYLVSTGEALTAETATAQVALTAGAAQTIDYSGDVNMSGKVDLNDAQLVYDLYNATYYDFSTVSMGKMLRADVSKDKKIDVSDVTAIVAIVRK